MSLDGKTHFGYCMEENARNYMDIVDGMICSQRIDAFLSANSGHQTEVPVYFYSGCIEKKINT